MKKLNSENIHRGGAGDFWLSMISAGANKFAPAFVVLPTINGFSQRLGNCSMHCSTTYIHVGVRASAVKFYKT